MQGRIANASLSRPLARFFRCQDGFLSVVMAILLPAMIMVAGIAIDLSDLNAQRKAVQSQADLAALSGVRNLSTASTTRAAAARTLVQSEIYDIRPPAADHILFGRLAAGDFVANPDQSHLDGVTAVKVVATSPARFPVLGRFFLRDAPPLVTRSAVAVVDPRVSFALSNCLLSLRLLNGLLEPLLGADMDLLCSGHGLRINAVSLMNQLALRGELLAPDTTYGDILDAELPLIDILEAAYGQTGLAAELAAPVFASERLRLGDFLHLAPGLREVQVTNTLLPPLELHISDVVFGALEVLGARIVDLDARLSLGTFAGAGISVQISEPRVIVLGAHPGSRDARAQSAQIRIAVDGLHLSSLLRLSLGINLANSTATLAAQGRQCSRVGTDTAAVFAPVTAELLNVDASLRLLGLPLDRPLAPVKSLKLMESSDTRIRFTHDEVAQGKVKEIRADHYQIDVHGLQQITGAVADLIGAFRAETGGKASDHACRLLTGCVLASSARGLGNLLDPVTEALAVSQDNLGKPGTAEGGLLRTLLEDVLGFAFVETQIEVLAVSCSYKLAL
mgnify:FL=1